MDEVAVVELWPAWKYGHGHAS